MGATVITQEFKEDLTQLLNKHNMESGSDTPDFVLADYLCDCLMILGFAIGRRDKWYSKKEG
jgi:hypothetical protein